MAERDCLSLLELQRRLKNGVEELFPERLWVKAEVAQLQARSNGHCYLDLVQNNEGEQLAKTRAVVWRNKWYLLSAFYQKATGSPLGVGQQVLVEVSLSYSELYGLTLVIEDISPEFSLGQAEKIRQETIQKLRTDGLLEKQQELTLCELPYSLAVISARDAAGYGDFCRHLQENEWGFHFEVDLFEAAMQGAMAPQSIAQALEEVETSAKKYDAALILRGGGSNLDLACFDDYSLCFAIANCAIPVFTAIGHDRDTHVADMVAYESVKTPTALADLFLDCFAAEDERICSYGSRLKLAFVNKISAMEANVALLESRILSADPRSILSRGYTLLTDARGVVVKSASALSKGDEISVYLKDGKIKAKVL